jgi:glycine/D-amino acid oxidase-like deaminating enzyme
VTDGPCARAASYRQLSLWHDTAGEDWTPRPALPGSTEVDVAIVGAGFTGLWAAYYLLVAAPGLRVCVLEGEVAGFGASGRNGGWCSALFPTSERQLARRSGASAAAALRVAMQGAVDEVGRVAGAESIDAHYAKGGTLVAARTPGQLTRARAEVAEARDLGIGPADLDLLDAVEAGRRLGATSVLGATVTPHCARIHPARLVRGLARAVERRGGVIRERTPVRSLTAGRVDTSHGAVRARHVLRATEGYTARLPGLRRAIAPVYSMMLATEPLPASFWDRVGLSRFETFSDHRHLIIYGQRTADDRLAFGGRGAPYAFGSRIRPSQDHSTAVHAGLWRTLLDMFPALAGHRVTHTWGGPLGIPRDWMASVGYDAATGLGQAGGYVGDGVATSNLAGRTLADLVLGRDTALTRLPWVGHVSPPWEPEPLRWLGVNAGLRLSVAADAEERLTGRPARLGGVLARLTGSP